MDLSLFGQVSTKFGTFGNMKKKNFINKLIIIIIIIITIFNFVKIYNNKMNKNNIT